MEDRQTGHQDVPHTPLTCKHGQVPAGALMGHTPGCLKYEFKTSFKKRVPLQNLFSINYTSCYL